MIPNTIFPIKAGHEVYVAYVVWFLLLYVALPVITYVIGLKHWRYSTTVLLAVSLWMFLVNFKNVFIGLGIWGVFFLVGLASGVVMFAYLQNKRMHYFVKVSFINLAVLVGIAIGLWSLYWVTGVSLIASTYAAVSVILLFSAIYEYVVLYSHKGSMEFVRRGLVTLLLAIMWGIVPVTGVGLAPLFRVHLLLLVVAFAILGIWIARWKNITFLEVFRFRSILSKERE